MTRSIARFSVFLAVLCAAAPLFAASFSSTTSGNWSSAATWGGAGVPGAGDTATVNGGHVVTLDIPVTVANLTLSGGQINGSQSLAVTTLFTWNGGTLSGSSTATIAAASVTGGGFLDTRALTNNGNFNFTAGNYIYLQNSATFINNGTIDFQGDGGGIFLNSALGVIAITNSGTGTIKKSGLTGSSTIQIPIVAQSGSQVLAQAGTLNVAAVTSTGATFSASSGATLAFNTNDTRTFNSASTVSGAGTIYWQSGTNTVNAAYAVTGQTKNTAATTITNITSTGDLFVIGSTLTLNSASTLSVGNLNMQGGTLAGTAPISLTAASQTWTGGTIAGSGLLTIPNGTTVDINTSTYFDTRPISNSGTLNLNSGSQSYFYNSAALTNTATGIIDFKGDSGGLLIGSGSPSVINAGLIRKSTCTTCTNGSYLQVALTSQSGSQVQVNVGIIYFGNVTSTGAAFSVASGATLYLYYTTTSSFDAASSISGAGTVIFQTGTNTINGNYNVTGATKSIGGTNSIGSSITAVGDVTVQGGTLTLTNGSAPIIGNIIAQGGTLTLNIPVTLSIATFTMAGGTVNGTASISLTGTTQTWTGGTVGGTGTFTIPNGTTIDVNVSTYFDTKAVSNSGTINYNGGTYSYLYNSATLTNTATGIIDIKGDGGGLYIGSGSPAVTNAGLIKKSTCTVCTNSSAIQVALTAQSGGQLQVLAGQLLFGNVSSTGASFTVSSGATMYLYYTSTASFDAASSISGAGTVVFQNGTNTISAGYNITGATKSAGGTTSIGSTITAVGDVTVSGGTLTLTNSSAPTIGNIIAQGGTLTLNIPVTLSIPTFTMAGGTVNGTASISITGTTQTWTGGTVGGTGTLTIPSGTTIDVNVSTYFDTKAVSNSGTINYNGGTYSYLYNSATLTNTATGIIDIKGDGGGLYIGSGSPSVTNAGLIKKSTCTVCTNSSAIQVALTAQSGGQVQVLAGQVLFGNITSTGASFSVSSGATMYFYYTATSSFDAASSIAGAGTVVFQAGTNTVSGTYNITALTKNVGATTTLSNITSVGDLLVSGGTLTLNSASAISTPTLTMQGGILNGTAPINITGTSMNWSAGTIGGTGQLSIPNGTTITVNGAAPIIDTRAVSNAGTINFVSGNYMYLQNNAVLTNSGTIDFQADGSSLYLNSAIGSINVINTATGIIKKSGGTTSTGSNFNVPLTMQSGSQFQLNTNGTLFLGNVTSTGGTFTVPSGATLYFYYTTTSSFDAASIISGAGTVVFQAGTNTVGASYNITGTTKSTGGTTTISNITSVGNLLVSAGTLTLNSASAISTGTLTMQGGILNGTAPINITGAAMNWTAGTIGGTGQLSIPNGTTITVNGSAPFIDTRAVSNAGTINLAGGNYIYLQNNAVLTNSGTIDMQADNSNVYLNGAAGTTAVVNAPTGVIKKSGGTTGTGSSFNVALTMQSGSQFQVNANGQLYLGNVTSTGGAFTVASGGVLWLYYTATGSLDAASSITGAGTLRCNAGTTTSAGNVSTSIFMAGGTLTLNSASPLTIPTLTMAGGTLGGTANISLTGAAMTWSGGIVGGTGSLSIPNGTVISINNGVPYFDARQVSNAGTINVIGGYYFYMQNNAVLTNSGTIDLQADSSAVYLTGVTGTTAVVNAATGVIKKSAGATNTGSSFTVPLTMQSGSQFQINTGIVYFGGTMTSTGGTFSVASGATMWLYYNDTRTLDATSSISGGGTLQVSNGTNTVGGSVTPSIVMNGGTLTLNSASTLTIPTLTMAGGTLNGTANVNLTGAAMTWSGGVIGGTGSLSIPSGTVVSINSGVPYFDARHVNNAGTMNIIGGFYIYMQNNAVLTNTGTVDMQADSSGIYQSGAVGTTSIVNSAAGVIKKSAGTSNTGSSVTVPLTMQSGSQFQVQTGIVYFGGTMTSTGGTLSISSGATAWFYYNDTRTFDAASTISGTGTLEVSNGTNTVAGGVTPSILVTGGTLTLNSAGAISIPTLTMQGGTLNGSANVSVTGAAMTWTGGTVGGSGTLSIPSGTTLTVNGVFIFDGRPVTNGGTITYISTNYFYMQNSAVLTNNGTITFPADNAIYLNTGSASIINNGFVQKTGGTGTSQIGVPFTNAAAGTLKSSTGTIAVSTLTQNGTLSFVASSATVFGKMSVATPLTLGGILSGTTTGGYTPPNGTTFQVLTFPSASGAFTTKFLNYQGGTFTDSSTATALTLTAGPSSCFAAPANVISWFKGEGNANDSTGPNNATGTFSTVSGKVGQALSFNGTSDTVAASDDPSLHPSSVTLEGWVNFSSVPGNAAIAAKAVGTGVNDSFVLWYQSGALRAAVGNTSSAAPLAYTFTPTTGTWYHVAFTFDGTNETLYLNGASVASGTTGVVIGYDSHPLRIGADSDNELVQLFFPGQIDELTLYSRALSAAEVLAIFNADANGKCYVPPPGPTLGTVTPSAGTTAGGTAVTITGTNLDSVSSITFGGNPATAVTARSTTSLTVTTPSHGAGTVAVSLTNPGGTTSTGSYTYVATPSVTGFAPSFGPPGLSVIISGSGFTSASAVTFNGTSASFAVNNDGQITATVPSGATTGVIAVTNPAGTGTSASSFTVTSASKLAITSINGGSNPKQNNAFTVTVQSQNASSVATNVFTSTNVTLSLATGSGVLGGTLTGIIPAGQNTITISGVTYSVAQSGVSVTASASGGDPLTPGTSATFTVDPPPTTVAVTNTNDSGAGSLRDALTVAGNGGCTPSCTITFNIAGGNPQTIALASALPVISQSGVTIDGTTQPGYSGTPVIVLNGSAAGVGVSGLLIGANNVTVKGLVINGFSANGIVVNSGTGSVIKGNFIGTNAAGTSGLPNSNGVSIGPGASHVTVGDATGAQPNTIAFNTNTGVVAFANSLGNQIVGNSTHDNGALGIDLNGDGATANDAGDSDTGADNLQNTPVILDAALVSGTLNVHVSVDSSAVSGTGSLRVELFKADSSGAEGQTKIASQCFAGNALTSQLISVPSAPVVTGNVLVATATSYSGTGCSTVNDGTSEFSAGLAIGSCAPPAVSITASPSATVCPNGSVTLDAGPGFASYSWSTGATTQMIVLTNLTSTTSVSVTVTDNSSCSNTASIIITVSTPTASITPSNPTSCGGAPVTLTANPGASYLWTPGNYTTQSISVSAGGTYSVTVTNAAGCSASASTNVNVYPNPSTPVITPSGPTTFCAGGNVTLSAPAGFASYLWSSGATTQNIAVTGSGTFSVTVTDVYGCSAASAPTTVTVTPAPSATITPSGPTTFCVGGSVTLSAPAGASSYSWSNGATTQSINVSASGNFTVTVYSSANCYATSAPTSVTVYPTPSATITPSGPTTFCAGGSVTLNAPPGMASYSWSNGATTQSINVTTSGNYSVTVTDVYGCTATSSPTTVNASGGTPPVATITPSGPTTFCAGGSVTLTAAAGATSYSWSNGATTQSITVSTSGNYTVTAYNASGCTATSAPTAVTVNPTPTPVITPNGPTSFCTGGSVTLAAPAGFGSYSWSTGATTQSISVNTSGSYTVTVTDSHGCTGTSAPVTVTVSASTGAVNITAPAAVDVNSTGNLASVPAGPAGTTYNWTISGATITAGQGTPQITFTAGATSPITIGVSVVTGTCTSNGTATVFLGNNADLKVTASASPNPVPSGSAVSFTINVSNLGPNSAQNVSVGTNISGATFSGATGAGWNCSGNGNPVTCTMALLAPGSAAPLVITATAGNGASAAASIAVTTTSTDPNPGDNSTTASAAITGQPPQCNNSAPSLSGPADNATVQSPVALSWTASANAIGYDVWAAVGNNAPGIIASTASTTASVPLPAGAVSWYVGARFTNCPTLFSTPRTFTVAAAQTCATAKAQLNSPLGGTVSSPVTFSWQAASQAIGYRVWVDIDGKGAQDVATTTGATTATVALTGGSVTWFVEAQFAGCPTTNSDTATFNLAVVDPCAGHQPASLVAPSNNASVQSSDVLFTWNAVQNAAGYLLWASVDGGAFAVIGKTNATQADVLIPHGTVEWYVETQFNGCPSTLSEHRVFNVPLAQTCGGQPATNLAPANVTVASGDVTFTWTAVPNAIAYEVWLGLSGATPSIVASTTTPSFHTTVAAGPLEFFIRTLFNGCDPVDSAHAQFVYAPVANCLTQTPILIAPADGAALVAPVDFSAAAVPGATQYRLVIGNKVVATSSTPQFPGVDVAQGPVSWAIEAAQNGCTTLRSTTGTFTVVAPPAPCADPPVPTLRADATASDGVQYIVRVSPLANALYEVQENGVGTTSGSPQFAFTHVTPTSDPVVFHYRARSINKCTGARSQFSDEITVTVLSSKPAGGGEANGSTPADNPQVTHYQIVIGGGINGSSSKSIGASDGQTFTATANVPWLTVTPSSGTVPAGGITLNVTANPTGLPIGTNTGAIDVTLGASNSSVGNKRVAPRDGTPTTTTVSVNLTAPVTSTAKSGPPPDALIIPAIAHAAGINSQFQSDVRITNTAALTVKYQLTFTPTGDEGSKQGFQTTVSIEPGRTMALDDILQSWFGEQSATGTLEIRPLTGTAASIAPKVAGGLPNVTTFAASRTFNNTANGTFGQFIPAIPFANFIGKDASTILSLQQVAQSAAYRTNFGLVEGSGNPVTALVSIFGSDGKKLTEFTQTLTGGQHLQMNGVIAQKGLTLSDGRIEVKPIAGTGKLTAYASVLNNDTSDPLLVSPVSVSTLGASKYVLPGVADLNNGFANWRTDARVYNAGPSTVAATATFYPSSGDPKSVQLSIAPGEVKVLDNILASMFGVTNTGGAVQFTTAANTSLVASARTYNVTSNGVYGQFIGAVTPADAAAVGTRALQLLQVEESNRYRTNVGIAEVGGQPAKVEITAIPPDSKIAATTTVDLAPNQFIQFNQLLKSMFGDSDVYNARVTLRVIDGQGRITGYASVVDMQTGDPSFVQAQ